MTRYVVVGAGIVGLATAHRILLDRPDAAVTVLEKEAARRRAPDRPQLGRHPRRRLLQAGQPQGAAVPRPAAASMVDFCDAHGIPHEICGKLIVATEAAELPRLHALHERAVANGLAGPADQPRARPREYEPHVRCVAALHVASTGIVDFAAVCRGARRAGREGRRRDPARRRGDRAAPDGTASWSTPRGASGRRPGQLRRPARRPGRPARRRRPAGADRAVPRRVLRAAPRAPATWCAA